MTTQIIWFLSLPVVIIIAFQFVRIAVRKFENKS
jgi:hypothetical protein